MIGKIFCFLCIFALLFSFFTHSTDSLVTSVFDGADRAVSLTVSLVGSMCLWSGCMNVFEKKGLIAKLSNLLSPVLGFIFPETFKNGVGKNEISSNVSANILGIGNAATPLGLSAMEAMNSVNEHPGYATDDMVMLVVLNTASLDILPTTLIALRRACESNDPHGIIIPTLISSFLTSVFAICITKLFSKIYRV